MASLITILSFLLVSLSALPASATKDSITWMEVSMPPYFIQEGPDKNQGYGDLVSAILEEQLPEYEHFEMVTNVIRHFDKFKQGEKVCSVGLYKTPEREEFMHFSIPSFLTLPPVMITRKDTLSDFGSRSSIKLEDILRDKKIIIGLSKDRSYGIQIDRLLKQYKDRENLIVYAGQELSANYFKMLMLKRIDGLIGLPDEAMYHAEKLGMRDQLATLIIEENQQGYEGWLCAVGCSKNEWGRAVIDKINKILLEQRPTDRYRGAYERWLDANSLQRYRTIYQEVFLQTTFPNN
ncbi:TIGR02285 family protein [uncultured Desulfobulbus sp.]|uniref:TIGR02285 family protein n=1 Tax=uncultured Desulfobulbus sp. TaxID=239745 RepID=UPI0029C979EF|nr:TIGR02285 family protein [uncultured Desulfobulbus sp.]